MLDPMLISVLPWPSREPFRRPARRWLLALATGSVAFWLWRRTRVRQDADAPNTLPAWPPAAARPARYREHAAFEELAGADPEWTAPDDSAVFPLPWAQRAALSLHLGGASELRRLAAEMRGAGLAAEAGLLDNYALLFERSRASRARILEEVTRMLREGAADRDGRDLDGALTPLPTLAVGKRRAR